MSDPIKEAEPLEIYTPNQISEMLDITAPTLRKYCGLISREYGSEYFKRSDTNARLYTGSDVKLLKRIKELKKAPSITLENAVSIALKEFGNDSLVSTVTPTATSDYHAISTDTAAIQALVGIVQQQSADIAQLMAANKQLSNDIQTLVSRLDTALNEPAAVQPVPENNPSLFRRIFSNPFYKK